jgi:Tfp pilus assembly protein PilV
MQYSCVNACLYLASLVLGLALPQLIGVLLSLYRHQQHTQQQQMAAAYEHLQTTTRHAAHSTNKRTLDVATAATATITTRAVAVSADCSTAASARTATVLTAKR